MRADLKALADAVIQAVRVKIAPLVSRMDDLDRAMKALPESLASDLDQRVQKAVDAIPRPKDGDPGCSVTIEDVTPLIADQVAKSMGEIPRPKDGESISASEVQRMVDDAVSKALAGLPTPKAGEDGRDALQLELQPCIDLEKSYARGTYAKHAGGLWRAFEATKGLHGWECVVEGIAELRIDQIGREFTLRARTSSGAEVSKSVKVASLVDKGVFKAGNDYEAGDGVTWGGSFFIAQKDAPVGHPGEPGSDGWRLAVKRGRDSSKGIAV